MNFPIILTIGFIWQVAFACEHTSNLKYVNDDCKDDSECYNGNIQNSVSCNNGRCLCNDGYVAQLQWFAPNDQRLVCNNAPYENQICTSVCQKPFVCVSSGSSLKPLDILLNPNRSVETDVKTCQCRPPYIVKDGVCYLECQSDEIYENGVCKKRCLDDENKEINGFCKNVSGLGGSCDSKNFCSVPFSLCISNVCVCGYGFEANEKKDACKSIPPRWCPMGDPIRTLDNKTLECKVVKKDSSSSATPTPTRTDTLIVIRPPPQPDLEDDCAEDQFCLLTSGEGSYVEGATGYCCLKPKLACPLGSPHPNATCGNTTPSFRNLAVSSNAPYCPYGTYTCLRWSFGGSYDTSLCCPTPCGQNQVYNKEKNICYPMRTYGDHCEIDDQCKSFTGICLDGICSCDKNFSVEGGAGYKYCRRVCPIDEVPVSNDQCASKLKLGDVCDLSIPGQCPTNAYCTEKKICDCYCGYVKLDDGSCAQQPTCPAIEGSKNPIFDGSNKVIDFTLCRIPGGSASGSATAVETCPENQYCSNYVQDYGLCCPKPAKPFCPDGATPGDKCDPKESNICGQSSYCNQYLIPAGNDLNDTHVCCPLQTPLLTPLKR